MLQNLFLFFSEIYTRFIELNALEKSLGPVDKLDSQII